MSISVAFSLIVSVLLFVLFLERAQDDEELKYAGAGLLFLAIVWGIALFVSGVTQ